jgi:hypothetical protein
VLLPELKDQVTVIVAKSAGALISAHLPANWTLGHPGGADRRGALTPLMLWPRPT